MKLAAAAAGKALLFKLRPALPGEGKRLYAIEMAAGELFAEIGMDDIASAQGTPPRVYEDIINAGNTLAACDGALVIAFIAWETRDDQRFIYEVSVHPKYQGRAVGGQLIAASSARTLSCFCDVPWNMPYYERLGFKAVDPAILGPEHVAIAKDEAKRFAPWPRCVMVRY